MRKNNEVKKKMLFSLNVKNFSAVSGDNQTQKRDRLVYD